MDAFMFEEKTLLNHPSSALHFRQEFRTADLAPRLFSAIPISFCVKFLIAPKSIWRSVVK
jgi:hypothetical protein